MQQPIDLQKKITTILKQNGIEKAELFGSYARGDYTRSSDIDILIDPPELMSMLDIVSLQLSLQDILKKPVNLLTYDSIHPYIKKYIFQKTISLL